MKALINRLTANWNMAAIFLGFHAWAWAMMGIWTHNLPARIVAAVLAVTAAGLLFRLRWTRLAGTAMLIWIAGSKAYGLVAREFTWKQAVLCAVYGMIAYQLWTRPDKGSIDDFTEEDLPQDGQQKNDDEDEAKPIISLVHLRRQPRYLEPQVLANALSEAWGLQIVGGEEDADQADGFVAGDNPLFLVMVRKPVFAMFMVHNRDTSYFDDPEEVASHVPNLRFAEIIREHSAWLAVDLMQVKDTEVGQDEAYRLIGKAVSALADDDVMAIFCPQHRFFNLWSPELEKLLCGDSPLDALREEVKAPVIGVPNGEAIEQAITEARQRWPEFVEIFKKRQPDDERFIVKAPFTGENGQVEHMWMQVFGLEPEYVHGHLVNHPMHTTKLKQGSQVEVPVATISDWVCPDAEGNPLGNFTHKAINQAAGQGA
ncbi:uncharacterized protein YegJ (DUF2314 family) [Prosthecobacter vanneervenii]|uniref:Uncharacterized protein YegJ (DUF2314 family) n=2 Tax=Prosthecobacter vanneervenii TaxID=48466 RepID=A0A7W8DML5_9BACT|nr:uncharacterized protein YegJ (DUF2314 family) [Prosthecobacter vanneervenii]